MIDLSRTRWKKSSRSGGNGQCVEIALLDDENATAVRDSKNPQGPVLIFSQESFSAFMAAAKTGKFA